MPDGTAGAERRTEVSSVLARVRMLIESGNYGPGSKLPPERALARNLGVGRPAIREAIKALSILDVLESRRGDGTYVKSLAALKTDWPAKVQVTTKEFSMLELLEVRKTLEPQAARLAASRAGETDLRTIEELRSALEKPSIGWKEVVALDYRLHEAIFIASKNSILLTLHHSLAQLLLESREITARSTPNWTRMQDDHNAIVRAIVRGEADTADEAMLEHMHHIGLDLISGRKR